MSTKCEKSYAEETVREIKNVAPAAVHVFLGFKSCDVRENCIQVEREGIAFINGYAMIKYINFGSQKQKGLDDKNQVSRYFLTVMLTMILQQHFRDNYR